MARMHSLILSYLLLALCVLGRMICCRASDQQRKVYIVYMGNHGEKEQSYSTDHLNMLQEVVDTRFLDRSLVRSYTRSFNGFAAYLTHEEREKLARKEEVVSIFPSRTFRTQTTRSWDFMGFPEKVHRNPTVESDTIIGVIDTGIWPESESFSDKGFSHPPRKWKGACKGGENFTCNNKIIGARFYAPPLMVPSYKTTRDIEGHGSHTASIAAGNYVKGTSFYGFADGTARGGVPSARIAAYKVCYPDLGCASEDILAAFDDAIADGVDIITVSLGGTQPVGLEDDVVAIGSLHAFQKGILVVQSAGNGGSQSKVSSTVPWIFTAAASTTDRGIITKVVLGNGTIITGKSVNPFDLKGHKFPLAYGDEVASSQCVGESVQICRIDCLDRNEVKGKVVLCSEYSGMQEVNRAGAVGSVVQSQKFPDIASVVPFPASGLSIPRFSDLLRYFNATKNHTLDILKSEVVKNLDAPSVASFSSRGPSVLFPNILKPDVTAPGVEIIAAYSPVSSPSVYPEDKRSVKYNILSGTSMSCPHVTGAAAYVRSFHPDWSPSAIKSALMTTAWRMNAKKDPMAELSYGTGHIDPVKAANPGLIYEILTDDYVKFLCGSGYDESTLSKIFGVRVQCPGKNSTTGDLNYPAMAFKVTASGSKKTTPFTAKFNRTVTNKGSANSTYKAIISKRSYYNITVNPSILKFSALNQKQSFSVSISGKIRDKTVLSASLEWSDGVHNVRSPIVVYTDNI
ncbi:subtilisin-like protease SBT4.13 [Primulina huaijiensis]|uniref:subtilisin-like protease SBT4.13 n=1 Tax=Primulina huaijiensis TaxID=1492673 RepID=UPI003CC75730